MERLIENGIEWLENDKRVCITLTKGKLKNKILKLYETHRDSFDYFVQNQDGSICANIPIEWIKISPKKQSYIITDEQKQALKERLAMARQAKYNKNV